MTANSGSDVLGLLDRQIENYLALLELGKTQAARSVHDWDGDSLLKLARSKSAVMGRVESIELELAEVRPRWDTIVSALTERDRKGIASRVDRLRSTLAELLALEEKNQQDLAGRMGSMKEEIDRTNRGRLIHKAYGQNEPPRERFLDQER